MAKYQADTIVIASVWPGNLEAKILYHGPDPDPHSGRATKYWIEPVERGSRPPYKLLEVFDSFVRTNQIPPRAYKEVAIPSQLVLSSTWWPFQNEGLGRDRDRES